MLAHLSGDRELISIFDHGRDLHSEVALDLFGPDYTSEDRVKAKSVNFGIVYGLTEFSLMRTFKITWDEAHAMIQGWYAKFPLARDFILSQRALPERGMYAESPFGRRRRFPLVTAENLQAIQNEACNHAIQSAASDLNLLYAMDLEPRLPSDCWIINLVHDSQLFEVPDDPSVVAEVVQLATESLDRVAEEKLQAKLRFTSDAKWGRAWGSLEKYVPQMVVN
jgi:DNA polymerase-1